MKLYSVSDEYIKYLRGKFPRVYSNKEDARTHTRKYLPDYDVDKIYEEMKNLEERS